MGSQGLSIFAAFFLELLLSLLFGFGFLTCDLQMSSLLPCLHLLFLILSLAQLGCKC